MRLRCNRCGNAVSTEVPEDTVVRAWLECPECVGAEEEERMPRAMLPQNFTKEELRDMT